LIYSASNLIEVPNRNIPVQYDIQQVERQQLQASSAVYAAIRVVNNEKGEAEAAKEFFAKTTLALNFAASQEKGAQAKVNEAATRRAKADALQTKAHDILETAHKVVRLAMTNVNNERKNVAATKDDLEYAQKVFDTATQRFEEANNIFINAEAQTSQAAQNAKAGLTAALNAQNIYNLAFKTYKDAKKILAAAIDKKTQANMVVNAARNALNLAIQVNDKAQSDLTVSHDNYKKAYSALDNANLLVSRLRADLQDSMDRLGVAKFNLQQANNNLFVAQAAKAAADKAVSLAYAQGVASLDALEGESTYVFNGCVEQAYPVITGTVAVSTLISSGAMLNSGQVLTWGDCTDKTDMVQEGDVVTFEGYIINGVVSARHVKKVNKH